ncbi:MAG: hypothetical protein H6665_16000 [Ardenticatenaceae bacterium]|nr:hypothetical protein [Ardenticatenaceae bacterium]
MKSLKLVVVGLVVTAVLVFGALTVLAQDDSSVPVSPSTGFGMMGGRQGGMGHGNHGAGMMGNFSLIDIVAQTLNLTVDQVWAELSTGMSIADLAADYDTDVQIIIDEALAQHQAALEAAVIDGTLTQEQADWMQANMESMITTRVYEPWGNTSGWGGGHGGCHGGQFAPSGSVTPGNGA